MPSSIDSVVAHLEVYQKVQDDLRELAKSPQVTTFKKELAACRSVQGGAGKRDFALPLPGALLLTRGGFKVAVEDTPRPKYRDLREEDIERWTTPVQTYNHVVTRLNALNDVSTAVELGTKVDRASLRDIAVAIACCPFYTCAVLLCPFGGVPYSSSNDESKKIAVPLTE